MTDTRILNARDHGEWEEVTDAGERARHLTDFWADPAAELERLVRILTDHPTMTAAAALTLWRSGQ